jgi:tetratricopeptide (TPR) repeat protein
MSHIQQLLDKIRAKLYSGEETGRLKSMHDRMQTRQKGSHPDFLDTHHPDGKRQSRLEHHAANFWHYYYPGEHPTEVVADMPRGEHEYWTEEQHRQLRERMIDPSGGETKTARSKKKENYDTIQQHWMYASMLGELALEKSDYAAAEKNFKQFLIESERSNVPAPLLAKVLRHLARSLSAQRKYSEFENVYEKALAIDTETQGSIAHFPEEEDLNRIAYEYLKEGRDEEAKELYQHILAVLKRVRGPKSAVVSRCLNDLAGIYAKTEEWTKAEDLLKQAIEICENAPETLSEELATSMYNLGSLYHKHERDNEAQELFGRATAILEKHTSENSCA